MRAESGHVELDRVEVTCTCLDCGVVDVAEIGMIVVEEWILSTRSVRDP